MINQKLEYKTKVSVKPKSNGKKSPTTHIRKRWAQDEKSQFTIKHIWFLPSLEYFGLIVPPFSVQAVPIFKNP